MQGYFSRKKYRVLVKNLQKCCFCYTYKFVIQLIQLIFSLILFLLKLILGSNTVLKRTPVVAVMGHVNHGKTTLLDAIRGTNVTSTEAGGITQNTRAHQIEYKGNKITFIDTPGHEAFSKMRSRGAKVTDMVVLVVAADDGVQPQTKESINFAKQQNVPIIVAINKIDVPGKSLQKLKQELATAGLLLEEYGGDVMVVEVSAIKKLNIEELLDRIILLAEINELKPEKTHGLSGRAFVLESKLDETRGAVALSIIKAGEVNVGDYIVYKKEYYRIRQILDSNQQSIDTCMQSDPVWLIGMDVVAEAGEIIDIVQTEQEAKELIKKFKEEEKGILSKKIEDTEALSDLDLLSSLLSTKEEDENIKYLNVVLKSDSQGTLEAICEQLVNLNDDEVQIKIVRKATGAIKEEDIIYAKSVHGIVIGFQLNIDKRIRDLAKKERVLIRTYDIIYTLIGELADVMDSMMEPKTEEVEIARAVVKKVFKLSNGQIVGGSTVLKGNLVKGSRVYVLRGEDRIGEGKITSLKCLKTEMKEVKKGAECGILIEPQIELNEEDVIVSYKIEKYN